jgi:hypothetical protein
MNYIKISFKNESTGKQVTASVQFTDSIASIKNDLKGEGLIINETETFTLSNNKPIAQHLTFGELGIVNKDVILIKTNNEDENPKPPDENPQPLDEKPVPPEREGNLPPNRPGRSVESNTPRKFHQLGIFVLDGSRSMYEKLPDESIKKDAVKRSMEEVLEIFRKSNKSNYYSFAVIDFGTETTLKLPVTELVDISHSLNFDPTPLHGGGTNIYAGLEHAHEIAKSFLAQEKSGDVPHTVRIVVLTDGECSDPMRTIQIANRIKADDPSIKIWSSFLIRRVLIIEQENL